MHVYLYIVRTRTRSYCARAHTSLSCIHVSISYVHLPHSVHTSISHMDTYTRVPIMCTPRSVPALNAHTRTALCRRHAHFRTHTAWEQRVTSAWEQGSDCPGPNRPQGPSWAGTPGRGAGLGGPDAWALPRPLPVTHAHAPLQPPAQERLVAQRTSPGRKRRSGRTEPAPLPARAGDSRPPALGSLPCSQPRPPQSWREPRPAPALPGRQFLSPHPGPFLAPKGPAASASPQTQPQPSKPGPRAGAAGWGGSPRELLGIPSPPSPAPTRRSPTPTPGGTHRPSGPRAGPGRVSRGPAALEGAGTKGRGPQAGGGA